MIRLIDIYECIMQDPYSHDGVLATHKVLYDLLLERPREANISHGDMPSIEGHVLFVNSKPYECWYLIQDWPMTYEEAVFDKKVPEWTGTIYLTHKREIGIFVFKKHQRKGIATGAIEILLEKHPGDYLANIAPTNKASIKFFDGLGAKLIQHTYAVEDKNDHSGRD